MTNAPIASPTTLAQSAEAEKALREVLASEEMSLSDPWSYPSLHNAYADIRQHAQTLAEALTAERERVKALEAAIRGLVNGWNAKIAEINRARRP